jgi:hypothetical protein
MKNLLIKCLQWLLQKLDKGNQLVNLQEYNQLKQCEQAYNRIYKFEREIFLTEDEQVELSGIDPAMVKSIIR